MDMAGASRTPHLLSVARILEIGLVRTLEIGVIFSGRLRVLQVLPVHPAALSAVVLRHCLINNLLLYLLASRNRWLA